MFIILMINYSHSTNYYKGHKEFSTARCLQCDSGGGEYDIIDEVIGLEKILSR